MKAGENETYRARTMRIGFEPSEPLKNAIGQFGKLIRTSDVIAQTTAFRAFDLDDHSARQALEQQTLDVALSLKRIGRRAVALASGVDVQLSPQSVRLFFNPEDPNQLINITRRMNMVRSGETYDRPKPAIFIDIGRASLRGAEIDDIHQAASLLEETMNDPDERRGFVLRSPRLVIRDVDQFPRRKSRAA